MATLTVQELGPNGAGFADISYTTLSDLTNDYVNDGRTLLVLRNNDASVVNLTVTSVEDPYGRTEDLALVTPAAVAGQGGVSMTGFLKRQLFGKSVSFDIDNNTDCEAAAIRVK